MLNNEETLELIKNMKGLCLQYKLNMAKRKTVGGKMYFRGQIKATELIIQTLENNLRK